MSDERDSSTPTVTVEDEPAAVLRRFDALWQELQAIISGMPEADLVAPGRIGAWSIKDLLAHLGRWDGVAATIIINHVTARPVGETYDDFEAWNARWAKEDALLSLKEARALCEAAYVRLRGVLAELPPERWDKVVRYWGEDSGAGHLEEHLAELRGEAQSA